MILIQAFVDVGDLTLAERVSRVLSISCTETPNRAAVSRSMTESSQAPQLLIGIDVAQFRDLAHAIHDDRRPVVEVFQIVGLERVLILRAAEATTNVDVLHRLQVKSGAGDIGGLRAQASDDVVGAELAFVEGLSWANMRAVLPPLPPPVKEVTVSTAGSCETMSVNTRIFFDISVKEVSWSAWMKPLMRPVSCWGKKPL